MRARSYAAPELGLLSGIAATVIWVALAAWLLTAAGLIGSVVRPDYA
jgi:hypothetical protein